MPRKRKGLAAGPKDRDPLEAAFADRLARAIALRGLQKQEVADAPGVEGSQLSNWLKTGSMSTRYLCQLPGILNVDGHWLLTDEGEPIRTPPEHAVVALRVIETVVDASRDDAAFDEFMRVWATFKKLFGEAGAD